MEETDINNIWGFNIRETLICLNNQPVIFFIDALEFIADCRTKLDLLNILYDCAKDCPNVRIITSCRTSDRNAFIKLEGNFDVKVYELGELTIEQQSELAKKYPIIADMEKIRDNRNLRKKLEKRQRLEDSKNLQKRLKKRQKLGKKRCNPIMI